MNTGLGFPGSFLMQLNELAGKVDSFIYNPKKQFQTSTPRLEKACGFFPHTSLNILPTGIELNMYIVQQKDLADAVRKQEENVKFYRTLEAKKGKIEATFGSRLEWNFSQLKTTHQQIAWRLPAPATANNQHLWHELQCLLLVQFSRFRQVMQMAATGQSDEDPKRTEQLLRGLRKSHI
jgi:Domain of unknown function (DUF4268)